MVLQQNGLLLDFNNGLIICYGASNNVKNIIFPMAFTTFVRIMFGIRWPKSQYGYDCVTALSATGFTLYDCAKDLWQMYIAIGF